MPDIPVLEPEVQSAHKLMALAVGHLTHKLGLAFIHAWVTVCRYGLATHPQCTDTMTGIKKKKNGHKVRVFSFELCLQSLKYVDMLMICKLYNITSASRIPRDSK